jgi:enoyl-CoA hydratase/carnithine racemase
MDEIITEYSESILRVELNRSAKRNAMASSMYVALAGIPNEAAKDDRARRALAWRRRCFLRRQRCGGFVKNPPGPGESPQARLMNALIDFDKPLIAAVHGAAIGGGTTMLTHCNFVYAGEGAKFQMPFINLALVPEFGSSCEVPLAIGHIRAAKLILLGLPFGATRTAELGLVTQVVSDQSLLKVAAETARNLAAEPAGALQASKRLRKRSFHEQFKAAMKAENEAFSVQVRSEEAKEAKTAFLEKRPPDFAKTRQPVAATSTRCRRTDVRNAQEYFGI